MNITRLPRECLYFIFEFLSPKHRFNIRLVSSLFALISRLFPYKINIEAVFKSSHYVDNDTILLRTNGLVMLQRYKTSKSNIRTCLFDNKNSCILPMAVECGYIDILQFLRSPDQIHFTYPCDEIRTDNGIEYTDLPIKGYDISVCVSDKYIGITHNCQGLIEIYEFKYNWFDHLFHKLGLKPEPKPYFKKISTFTLKALSRTDSYYIPNMLAFGPNNRVYIIDSVNCRIQVFTVYGRFLFVFGTEGSEPGQFKFPNHIVIDNNNIFIVDTQNSRIQVFDLDGKYITKFGEQILQQPMSMVVDTDNIYVIDEFVGLVMFRL